jgi:PrcB C-terminal
VLVLAIGGAVAYTQLVERSGAHEIPWSDVTAKLGPVRWPKQFSVAFHSRRALVHWLAQNTLPPKPVAPQIDFRHRALLLAAVGPRSSTGYSVEVVHVTERRSRIDVLLRERTPRLGERQSARLTFPYRLLTIHATTKPIYFSYEGRP